MFQHVPSCVDMLMKLLKVKGPMWVKEMFLSSSQLLPAYIKLSKFWLCKSNNIFFNKCRLLHYLITNSQVSKKYQIWSLCINSWCWTVLCSVYSWQQCLLYRFVATVKVAASNVFFFKYLNIFFFPLLKVYVILLQMVLEHIHFTNVLVLRLGKKLALRLHF